MELEEMRAAWFALGEKLDRKDKMSAVLIREMYRTKVKKSLNAMLGFEIFGIVICVLFFPFIVYQLISKDSLLMKLTLIYWIVFAIIASIWTMKKIVLLVKLDETGKVKDNLIIINTYAVWIHKEKPYYAIFATLGFVPVFMIMSANANPFGISFFVTILLLATLSSVLTYKRLYNRNIQSIQLNLDELRDLEDN